MKLTFTLKELTALQKAVDNLIHESDQLDIVDARQQDEIDYLRKRVEALEAKAIEVQA